MHLSAGLNLNWGEKSVPFLVKTFFFGLHLICSPEKNCGRGPSSPMLKIGQNWGKVANYPRQCSTKIGTPAYKAFAVEMAAAQRTRLHNRAAQRDKFQ